MTTIRTIITRAYMMTIKVTLTICLLSLFSVSFVRMNDKHDVHSHFLFWFNLKRNCKRIKHTRTHTGNLIKKKAIRIAMIINNYHFSWRNMMRLHSWEYDQMMSFLYDIAVRSIDDIKTEKSSFPLRYVQCLVVCLFNNIDNTNNF